MKNDRIKVWKGVGFLVVVALLGACKGEEKPIAVPNEGALAGGGTPAPTEHEGMDMGGGDESHEGHTPGMEMGGGDESHEGMEEMEGMDHDHTPGMEMGGGDESHEGHTPGMDMGGGDESHEGHTPGMDMGGGDESSALSEQEGMEMGGLPTISVAPEIRQAIGIRTEKVTRGLLVSEVVTVGVVYPDERTLHKVQTRFSGWVETVFVNETGSSVQEGQPLIAIYSPEVLATQKEVLIALKAQDESAQSGNPDLVRGSGAMVAAAKERLRLWGVPQGFIESLVQTREVQERIIIPAPASGVVLTLHAQEGMRITPGMTLFSLADLATVWVQAEIYEGDLARVKLGAKATVSLDHLPGAPIEGVVSFIHPTVNGITRTTKARIELPNPHGVLRPGMYASALIEGPERAGVWVPLNAVIRTGERDIAFVQVKVGVYQPTLLTLGGVYGEKYEVLSGLVGGEMVVSRAAFLLDSERSMQSVAPGMGGHQH